jgi:DNA-binding NarL/FixJ family response regulator
LSALGFDLRELALEEPVESGRIVLLDAGTEPKLAVIAVKSLRSAYPEAKYIACLLGIDAETLNQLIEAGAYDVVRGPVSSDVLSRKLGRLARKS